MTTVCRRLAHSLRGRRAAEELELHRDMAQRDLRQCGLTEQDAARAARRAMGNTTLAREDAHAVWVAPWVDGVWQVPTHSGRGISSCMPERLSRLIRTLDGTILVTIAWRGTHPADQARSFFVFSCSRRRKSCYYATRGMVTS